MSGSVDKIQNTTDGKGQITDEKMYPGSEIDLFEHLAYPAFAINSKGIVIAWNHEMELISGILSSEIIGKGDYAYSNWINGKPHKILIDYALKQDQDNARKHYPHLIIQGSKFISESLMVRPDGTRKYLWITAIPILNSEGSVIGAIESIRDVTDQKIKRVGLAKTKKFVTDIINFLPDPTFVIDSNGTIIAWNHEMELFSGISAKDMIGKGDHEYSKWIFGKPREILIDYVLNQDLDTIKKRYPHLRIIRKKVISESEITLTDGVRKFIWITATPLINDMDEIIGAIESIRDVTNQKKAHLDLLESKKYLDAIINSIADPVYVKDQNHNWVLVNNAACNLFGLKRDDLIGKSEYDLYPQTVADIIHASDDSVFQTGKVVEHEEEIIDTNGLIRTNITKKTIYVNMEGKKFLVGVIRDITERKNMEGALKLANEKLNILSSITRHDILNSITALHGYLEISLTHVKDDEKLSAYLQKELTLTDMIKHQIEFTKFYQDIGVNSAGWQDVAKTIRIAAHQLKLSDITLDIGFSGLEIYADALIGKVFYNLIENTIRHGEHVTNIAFSIREDNSGLTLIYMDNGIGVEPESKKKIFDRGFGKHTGFGLFLTREILSITGISIVENGEPGKGVRFEIRINKGKYRFNEKTLQ